MVYKWFLSSRDAEVLEHYCSRDPGTGVWGGYECSRNARSIPGKNIHSSMTLLTALLTHGICFFFTYFSFYYQCLEKIIFILTVSLCKFTVINATQISKFEREMQQQ